jgi:aminoglycoside phosphotransferase (APT) family kinase protein
VTLEACLPERLRGPETTITRMAMGFSGAGVYRVEAGGQMFVLKITDQAAPIDAWRRALRIQQLAANASITPQIVHIDEERRAIVTAFVVDKTFASILYNPPTRDAALDLAAATLNRLHQIPAPDSEYRDPLSLLSTTLSPMMTDAGVPPFAREVIQRLLTEKPPSLDRAMVLSHNDVNPTNIAYDGERLLLLDWDVAALNDPLYDLATLAMFFRMDDAACGGLLAAYDGESPAVLPERFVYNRRLVAVLCGALFLGTGTEGAETLEDTASLAEIYRRMMTGALNLGAPEGRRAFGLALIKEGITRG